MNNRKLAKQQMILRTGQLLGKNSTITASLPTFAAVNPLFTADTALLYTIGEQLEVDYTAAALIKSNLQKDMADKAFDLSLKAGAYATLTGNNALMAACSCTKSELYYASAIAARNKAQAIYNAVNPIVASLSTYGVTAAVLTALKTAIDAFAAAIPSPQLSVSDRKELNLKMDRTLDDAELQLSKIDAMVEVVRLTQPVFYSQYKDARRIIISSSSLSLKGNVLDAETGKALSGVQLNIEPLAQQTSKMAVLSSTETSSIKRLTAPKGGFRIKNLPQGSYQLKASIPGYADQTITVHIVDGQRSDIDLNLERLA